MWCIYQAINIIINFFTIGPPLDVMAPMVGSFNKDNMAGVRINWTHNDGNYDCRHFTVQVFENNTLIKSIDISAERNSYEAILTEPISAPIDVYARITVTSKCNQTTDGVLTDTIRINKS